MTRRLWKEFRVLAVPWVLALAVVPLATWMTAKAQPSAMAKAWAIACAIQYVLFQMMGVQLFAAEFHYGTMPRLLGQPMRRTLIWREKLLVLLVLLMIAAALSVRMGGSVYRATARYATHNVPVPSAVSAVWRPQPLWQSVSSMLAGRTLDGVPWAPLNSALEMTRVDKAVDDAIDMLNLGVVVCVCGFFGAVCCGPCMALALRQGHTAFWAALVAPVVYLLLVSLLFGLAWPLVAGLMQPVMKFVLSPLPKDIVDRHGGEIFALLPWFIVMYALGRRRFLRLEV